MAYLDLGELDQVFAGRWFWSTTGKALVRFDRRDHFGDPELPLDEAVRALVAERTGQRPAGPIRLLTHLRHFGYAFNPACFYYCFDAAGEKVQAVVAEVTNTPWRERHCYVLQSDGSSTPAMCAHSAKAMHVSPFHPMELGYEWRFTAPAGQLAVHMALHATDAAPATRALFDATLTLQRRPIGTATLASALVRFPLMTAKVIAAIHWQALRLWLKGVPVHDHPALRTENAG
jgi:hypothetical protein